MADTLLVGFSEIDITPPAPVTLLGQFHTRVSTHVESPLLASVMAMESKDEALIMCVLDLALVELGFARLVREKIKKQDPGLPVEKIIFSVTHTHTGPNYYSKLESLHVAAQFLPEGTSFSPTEEKIPAEVWDEKKCGEYIAEKTCQAVVNAWQARKKAWLAPQFGRAVTGHNRRTVYDDGAARMYGSTETVNFTSLEGGNDSGIELLYIFDEAKKPLGALVNVVCPSQVVEGECYISSDYWGKARDMVKARLGSGFIVLGLCGAAGDQSPRDLIRRRPGAKVRQIEADMRSLEGAIELGRRVSGVVLDKYQSALAAATDKVRLGHKVLQIDFPLRRVTDKENEAARSAFMDYVQKSAKKVFDSRDMTALHIYGGIMDRYLEQQDIFFFTSEVHVVRIGDIAIATNPFELFLDFGNQIKALSKADQTFIIQLACDSGGYLPTRRAEAGSHYSAYVSSGRTGHAGGDLLVRKTVASIQELWQDK